MVHGTHNAEADERNKDIKIFINGELLHRDDAKISVFDSGYLVGDGVWEALRLHNDKLVFLDLTIFFALTDNFFALMNHCSVKKGSIIELDLSPYGTLFLIFSSLTKNSFSLSSFRILFLASNLSRPI